MLCALDYARGLEGYCWYESLCVWCVRCKAWGVVFPLQCAGEGLVALRSGLCEGVKVIAGVSLSACVVSGVRLGA